MADTTFASNFYTQLQADNHALRERLEHTKATANRIEFSSLVQDVAKLRKALIDAIPLLPLYDQRQAELVVRSLEQELEVARAQITSPAAASGSGKAGGRFAFRRIAPVAAPKVVAVAPTMAVRASDAPSTEWHALSIANRTYEYLCSGDLPAEQPLERGEHDLSISNLSHCIVDFVSRPNNEGLGRIRALYARNVTRCVLIMPIIEGSVLLYEFKDCTIVLGCHQFRIHNSNSVDVYLHVTSTPIIERCTVVRFAPYTLSEDTGLDEATENQFNNVQDFLWLRGGPSPNWSLIPEEEWIGKGDSTWPLGSLSDVDQTLSALIAPGN